MKKLILAACMTFVVSASVAAEDFYLESNPDKFASFPGTTKIISTSFNSSSSMSEVNVFKKEDDPSAAYSYSAGVQLTDEGIQTIFVYEYEDKCSPSYKFHPEQVVLRINGRNVYFTKSCYDVETGRSNSYYPTTHKGKEYVVNQFKTGYYIVIEGMSHTVEFNAKGFTSVWNGYGGDAL